MDTRHDARVGHYIRAARQPVSASSIMRGLWPFHMLPAMHVLMPALLSAGTAGNFVTATIRNIGIARHSKIP